MNGDSARQTSLTLLHRLRANEPDAWVRLVELYRPLVVYWCSRAGVYGADAEDACQEVFLVASRRIADFRRERPGDTFRGWLRGVARNVLLAHARRVRANPEATGGSTALLRIHHLPDGAVEDDTSDDPESEVQSLVRRAVELVRAEFQPVTWQAFFLTAVDGRSAPDVAATLGISTAAVRQAKSRVLRRVKQELGELAD